MTSPANYLDICTTTSTSCVVIILNLLMSRCMASTLVRTGFVRGSMTQGNGCYQHRCTNNSLEVNTLHPIISLEFALHHFHCLRFHFCRILFVFSAGMFLLIVICIVITISIGPVWIHQLNFSWLNLAAKDPNGPAKV